MRFGGGLECTAVFACGVLATLLDSSIVVNWYATVHASATVTGPDEGHERAGPEDREEDEQRPPPAEEGEACCPDRSGSSRRGLGGPPLETTQPHGPRGCVASTCQSPWVSTFGDQEEAGVPPSAQGKGQRFVL